MLVLYKASRVILWFLIIVGSWGALLVSYTTITGTARCPDFVGIPICYLVGIGYISMLVAQAVSPGKLKNCLFYPGWVLVFLIAVLGTGFEISVDNICPRSSSGVPMCYFSFVMCIVIIIVYKFTSNTRILVQR